ncbi:MAG: RDD family protein [Theionarchaea archaeon]|nr:RDD family protein [Theionarchaea archaeon]MBU6999127.1 RDD family protein [Theionarchaea archaeon]MBU7019488.1 RDD family protein [Theionarchaea archaeon]MBU7041724.1 RDD family protein [Theionarchaea archaeon]
MEDFTLSTSENVPVYYDIATAGSRCVAFLVDYSIILLASMGLIVTVDLLRQFGFTSFSSYAIALIYVVVGTLTWGYFVISELALNGSSIGKRMIGLRVIKEDATPIDLVDSLTRNFVRYIDLWPGTCLVGFVVMMLNAKSKRLGDYAAGTIVVRTRAVGLDKLELGESSYDDTVSRSPYLNQITSEEYQLMRDFLFRYEKIPFSKAYEIATKITSGIAEKLHIEPPRGIENCILFLKSCIKYYRHKP